MHAEPASLATYRELTNDLLSSIDALTNVAGAHERTCAELRAKIRENVFNLVVVGQFKRGKTSLINALLGADILPMAVVPLTSIVTIMTWGDALGITVSFLDGTRVEIAPDRLAEYVTEKGNPRNVKAVSEVVVTYPSPYLRDHVRLIDTPGVGSLYQHNTDVAYRYLPKADAALFLLSVDQPMGRAELDFLQDVKEYSHKIFFLLNKADYLSDTDLAESVAFTRSALRESLGADVTLFPLSARLAREAVQEGSAERLARSGLPLFSAALSEFLMQEKGAVLVRSATKALQRAVGQTRFEQELELRSLETPLESLRRKIAVFEEKKEEVRREKEDFAILLDAETRKLGRDLLDSDITRFRKDLLARERTFLEEEFRAKQALPSRELREVLEGTVIERVRRAFSAWRAQEDERLARAFEKVCARFATKINDTVDDLMRFSSELFAIPFAAIKTEMLWSDRSRFSYKFRDEPVGLQIVTSSLTLALPKFIGDRLILGRMQEYLVKVTDMQAGRLGADFEERLDRSKLSFRGEMLEKIDSTIEGISAAIEKGMRERSRGETEAGERKKELGALSGALDDVARRLGRITETAMRMT